MCGSQSCKAIGLNEGLLFHRDKPGGLGALGVSSDSPVNDPLLVSPPFLSFLNFHWEEGPSFPLPLLIDDFNQTASLIFSPGCLHKPHSLAAVADGLFSLTWKTPQTWAPGLLPGRHWS